MQSMDRGILVKLLTEVGEQLGPTCVELTLVGGAAGMLAGWLAPTRTTIDCDVIRTEPDSGFEVVRQIAIRVGRDHGMPEDWLSAQVAQLDVLPVGWRKRRVLVGQFGAMKVWSVGRVDLIATKVFAGRMQDRADVVELNPNAEGPAFVRQYLDQLRIPSREASLDQVQSAFRFVAALEAGR